MSLLPLPVHFFLVLQFDQQVSTHPQWSLAFLSWFLILGNRLTVARWKQLKKWEEKDIHVSHDTRHFSKMHVVFVVC